MNAKTNKSKSPFRRHALYLAVLTLLYPAVLPANPTGAQVISGQVSIDQSISGITTVTNTPNAIINWQDFNIAQNEITRFIQQNGQSAVLNRIIGGNPSEILGSLFSNGQVFLINPNGVIFGAGATIDTQGLIASSLNLSDSDFQKGNFHFIAGSKTGDISNEGIIHAGKDGNIVLIAPNIENKGIIQSDGGKITLAAGQELILTSMDEPDIRFQVQAPQNQALNVGQLLTEGGAINVFAGSIKHSGDISANSVSVNKQGDIHLIAKDNITLESGSKISANNGGKVVVLSDNETHAHGEISATGGFVETSGKKLDTASIQVKARDWLLDPYDVLITNEQNASGTPFSTNFTPATQSILSTISIEAALNNGTNVAIATANVSGTDLGNITVASNIRKNSGTDSTFTLKADNAIIISPDVIIEAIDAGTGKLNIVLNAGNGNIQLNAGTTLNSNGGNIVLGGGTCTTTGCTAAAKGYGSDENEVEGITLSNATLNSAGGNIFLKGEGFSGTGVSNATGILISESKIDSGTGSITIQGTGGDGTYDEANDIGGENNSGVVMTGTLTNPSLILSTGAIELVAENADSITDSLIFENSAVQSAGQLTLEATGGISLHNAGLSSSANDISLTSNFISTSGLAVLKTGTISSSSSWISKLSNPVLSYSNSVPSNATTGNYVVYREVYPTTPPPSDPPVTVHPTPEEIEAARLAAEKAAEEQKNKLEAEKAAAEKLAEQQKAKLEAEKAAAEKLAEQQKAKLEAEKAAAEKLAEEQKAKLEAEKAAAEKLAEEQKAKLEAEKAAAEKLAEEQKNKLEAEKAAAEKAKAEAEKLAAEKAKAEAEKLAAEKAKAEAEKLAAEKAKAEAEKLAAEKAKAEAEKLAAEKAKAEAEKLAAEKAKAEAEKLAAEEKAKLEAEKLAAEEKAKLEAEKLAAEAAAKAEADRLAAEAAAKAEANRLAAEAAAKAEANRLAAEAAAKAEAERLAAEAAAKAEADRLAAEAAAKAETERLAAEARAKTPNPVAFDTIASIAQDLAPQEAAKIVENIDNTAKQQMGAVILNSGSQSSSSANMNQLPPPPLPPEPEATKQESSASDKPDEKKEKNTQIAAVTTSETKTPQPLQQCK
ncbi:MAG: filamentous hemagglutinin N-terminal domain-containing protein [Methylococcales bacterium]|nr:filamentous hemagglutinin N-terminal domain-containing protein [Methylococcales bacterium]